MIIASTSVYGTEQIPDILILNGEKMDLFSTPLEPYLKNKEVWATFRKFLNDEIACTADWNGYLGKWKIFNNKLFLVGLYVGACDERPKVIPLNKIFEKKEDIFAFWYSGYLIVPRGQTLPDKYIGFSPRYEKYLIIEINKGNVISKKTDSKLPFENP